MPFEDQEFFRPANGEVITPLPRARPYSNLVDAVPAMPGGWRAGATVAIFRNPRHRG